MGNLFPKAKKVVKQLDPELVSFALSGILLGILSSKPEYADQMEAIFITLKKTLSKEDLTEEELHGSIQKALEDIGVDDPQAQLAIKLFLTKLDRLADKYLDVAEGFTEEERQAWTALFDDLLATVRLFKHHA